MVRFFISFFVVVFCEGCFVERIWNNPGAWYYGTFFRPTDSSYAFTPEQHSPPNPEPLPLEEWQKPIVRKKYFCELRVIGDANITGYETVEHFAGPENKEYIHVKNPTGWEHYFCVANAEKTRAEYPNLTFSTCCIASRVDGGIDPADGSSID